MLLTYHNLHYASVSAIRSSPPIGSCAPVAANPLMPLEIKDSTSISVAATLGPAPLPEGRRATHVPHTRQNAQWRGAGIDDSPAAEIRAGTNQHPNDSVAFRCLLWPAVGQLPASPAGAQGRRRCDDGPGTVGA
jgi:hypothetical protein